MTYEAKKLVAYIGLQSLAKIVFFLAIFIRNLKIRTKNDTARVM